MLDFYITGQNLKFYSPVIAADSLKYLTAQFHFIGDEWNGYTRWAHFRKGTTVYDIALDANDTITEEAALNLTTGEWDIYLTGTKNSARLTTIVVVVTVKESGLVDAPLHVIPQSAAEQIDAKAAQALLVAQAVKAMADAGKFNGKDGKGLEIQGFYESFDALSAAVTEPKAGEAYGIGSSEPYDIYIWDATNAEWVNNGQIRGAQGDKGEPGVTYIPHVDANGNLSWTNDAGVNNPATQNIRGPAGAAGAKGDTGKSAYDAAVEAGYTGTEATFYAALTAFPFHNARHLPTGADPLVCVEGNYGQKSIPGTAIKDGIVTAAKIAAGAITAEKLASNSVSANYTGTIGANWSGTNAPYSITVTIKGILASDTPFIDLVASDTWETAEQQIEAWGYVYKAVTKANAITFYASEKPAVSIPIKIKAVRK